MSAKFLNNLWPWLACITTAILIILLIKLVFLPPSASPSNMSFLAFESVAVGILIATFLVHEILALAKTLKTSSRQKSALNLTAVAFLLLTIWGSGLFWMAFVAFNRFMTQPQYQRMPEMLEDLESTADTPPVEDDGPDD